MRDVLIQHLDGGQIPITKPSGDGHAKANRYKSTMVLIGMGFLKTEARQSFPKWTMMTDTGRRALTKALGDWADALDRAYQMQPEIKLPKPPANPEDALIAALKRSSLAAQKHIRAEELS